MEQWLLLSFYYSPKNIPTYERKYDASSLTEAVGKLLQSNGATQMHNFIPNTIYFADDAEIDTPDKLDKWGEILREFVGLDFVIAPLFHKQWDEYRPMITQHRNIETDNVITKIDGVYALHKGKVTGLSPEQLSELEYICEVQDLKIYKHKVKELQYLISEGYLNHQVALYATDKSKTIEDKTIINEVVKVLIEEKVRSPETWDPYDSSSFPQLDAD